MVDVVRRTAEVCFMPLTVGGGVRTRRGCARAAARRRRQGRGQFRRRRPPRTRRRHRRALRQPVRRRLGRCAARAATVGKSSPMAAAARPASTRSHTPLRLAELGAGEMLVTSMDRDGTRDGYDLALTRAVADAVRVPVVASGGVGNLDHLVAGVTQATPAPCSPPRSSISAKPASPSPCRARRRGRAGAATVNPLVAPGR